MILRRDVALATAAAMMVAGAPASAEPLTADRLPPALLGACDANAAPFGAYDLAVARSVAALDGMGAIWKDEFATVRIGFCGLVAAGGPVAAASCADDIILLDEKYAAEGQALALNATLAHEMKHHFQHRAAKARHGDAYCESAAYAAGKEAMETEADAFGEAVGELFFLGRPVEIVNECVSPVAVYLEADEPAAAQEGDPAFETVAARSARVLRARAYASRFYYHAQTLGATGPRVVFENRSSPHRRFIDGRQIRLKEARLDAAGREKGPFRLTLSCAAAHD